MPIIREVGKNLPLAKEGFTWARCVIGYLFMCLALAVCCRARAILSITVPPAAQPRGRRLGVSPCPSLERSTSSSCPWDTQHPHPAPGMLNILVFPSPGNTASPSCAQDAQHPRPVPKQHLIPPPPEGSTTSPAFPRSPRSPHFPQAALPPPAPPQALAFTVPWCEGAAQKLLALPVTGTLPMSTGETRSRQRSR